MTLWQRRWGLPRGLAILLTGLLAGGAVRAYEDGELLQRRLGAAEVSWHAGSSTADPVHVRLLGINDLHGQLETHIKVAGSDGSRRVGGAAVLMSYLAAERDQDPAHTLTLIAGDSIGASSLLSGLLHDEPMLAILNGLAGRDCPALRRETAAASGPMLTRCRTIATVGNHEFDHGPAELERQLYGGAHTDGSGFGRRWEGSHVPTLASNVRWRDSERPFLPASAIVEVDGARIGIIGAVTAQTPALVSHDRVAALRFDAEAPLINAAVKELRAQGAHAIVLLIHEGLLAPTNPIPAALAPGEARGRLAEVLGGLDGGVDVVVAGHTHQLNNVLVPLREGPPALVVQGDRQVRACDDHVGRRRAGPLPRPRGRARRQQGRPCNRLRAQQVFRQRRKRDSTRGSERPGDGARQFGCRCRARRGRRRDRVHQRRRHTQRPGGRRTDTRRAV
ncbi:MAG: metallophosphoesterase [Proteobacteria bacterium]|nr:metallophosphoesterase [Pseudomonadota bacterium]